MGTVQGRDIVVVGSLNRDFLIEVEARPQPGETVTGAKVTIAPGGKGANQAAAAARAGARVALIGRIGDDDAGDELMTALRAAGVETADVIVTSSAVTGSAFITVTPDGENSIIVSSGANALLGSGDLRARESLLAGAAVLLLQHEVSEEAIESAVQLAAKDTLVVLNAAPYRALGRRVMDRVDVLLVNALEARQLLGDDASIEDAAAFARLGPTVIIVTLGAGGARAYVDGRIVECPAPPTDVVDTTGAGDAFAGGLAAWLTREPLSPQDVVEPITHALSAASAAAAYSLSRLGAQSSYGRSAELGPPWS